MGIFDADASLRDDFAADRLGAVTLLRNATSPAATSALAIADHVLERYPQIARQRGEGTAGPAGRPGEAVTGGRHRAHRIL